MEGNNSFDVRHIGNAEMRENDFRDDFLFFHCHGIHLVYQCQGFSWYALDLNEFGRFEGPSNLRDFMQSTDIGM